jgi:hypothetical protein
MGTVQFVLIFLGLLKEWVNWENSRLALRECEADLADSQSQIAFWKSLGVMFGIILILLFCKFDFVPRGSLNA